MIHLKVECYSGYKKDERPLRFTLGERTFEIVTLDDTWYSPEATYFRVKANDGQVYILRHDETKDEWTLEVYRATE